MLSPLGCRKRREGRPAAVASKVTPWLAGAVAWVGPDEGLPGAAEGRRRVVPAAGRAEAWRRRHGLAGGLALAGCQWLFLRRRCVVATGLEAGSTHQAVPDSSIRKPEAGGAL